MSALGLLGKYIITAVTQFKTLLVEQASGSLLAHHRTLDILVVHCVHVCALTVHVLLFVPMFGHTGYIFYHVYPSADGTFPCDHLGVYTVNLSLCSS